MKKKQKIMPKYKLNIGRSLFFVASLVILYLVGRTFLFLDAEGSAFPHWDEWRFQNNHSFWQTIFTLNNENFQVFTNALYWGAPRIGLPFWGLRYISFALFLLMLWVLWGRLFRVVPKERRFMLMLAFCPCFSGYMCSNLLWTVLSQTWMFFLFILLAIKYGFEKQQTLSSQLVTLGLVVAACLAMNVTLPMIFVLLYMGRIVVFKKAIKTTERKYGILGAGVLMVGIVCLYMYIRSQDVVEFSLTTLLTPQYWLWLSYSLVGVWSGFWVSAVQTWFYYLVGGLMLIWLCVLFVRQIGEASRQPLWALCLLLCCGMAMITLYRGAYILELTTHVGRHMIYGVCLLPVIYALGASDKNKFVRYVADGLLIGMLGCWIMPIKQLYVFEGQYFSNFGDVCLIEHLHSYPQEEFSCGRYFDDVREPYAYFLSHDAAFRQYYQNKAAGAVAGFVPYHFEGKVFYKIPGKKILLFR